MSVPIKPWESFEAQLARLKARGLQVDDERQALHDLQRLGYYRLSGYWYPLRKKIDRRKAPQGAPERANTFMQGSRFEDVVRLYEFDKQLRLLALDALERIELAVRVDVAYLLGKRDPLAHEKPEYLHGDFAKKTLRRVNGQCQTAHDVWMEKYGKALLQSKREPFVAHHLEKYKALPIWAAIELWDFGMLSLLFSGMRLPDKHAIAVRYGAKDGGAFAQWLRSLNYIRNTCAHHNRLWNARVTRVSPPPAGWSRGLDTARPFFYFCLMQHLLRIISPNSGWHLRLKSLLVQAFPDEKFTLKDFGLLPGWGAWPLWR